MSSNTPISGNRLSSTPVASDGESANTNQQSQPEPPLYHSFDSMVAHIDVNNRATIKPSTWMKVEQGEGDSQRTIIKSLAPVTQPKRPDNFQMPDDSLVLNANETVPEGIYAVQAPWGEMIGFKRTDRDAVANAMQEFGYFDQANRMPVSDQEEWSVLPSAELPASSEQAHATLEYVTAVPQQSKKYVMAVPQQSKKYMMAGHQQSTQATLQDMMAQNQPLTQAPKGPVYSIKIDIDVQSVLLKSKTEGFLPIKAHDGTINLADASVDYVRSLDISEKRDKLRPFLKYLARIPVRATIVATDNICLSETRLFGQTGDEISAALAYAIVIGVRGNERDFACVISQAPTRVMMEAATYARGRLFSEYSASQVIKTLVREMAYATENIRGQEHLLCDSASNIIAALFRNWEKQDKGNAEKARLQKALKRLLNDAGASYDLPNVSKDKKVKAAAVMSAMVVSGLLKFIGGMSERHMKRKENAELGISVALSVLGYAPIPGVAGLAGTLTLIATALMDYFWEDTSKGLDHAVKSFVQQAIYWPLEQERESTALKIEDLSTEEVSTFRRVFDLVLMSAQTPGT